MELHVVACRFDPLDVARPQKKHAAARLDDETFERLWSGFEVVEEGEQLAFKIGVGTMLDTLAGARERVAEAVAVEGLEQVIEGVHVEGAKRIAIERGHENHKRHARGANRLDDVEAGSA